MKYQASKWLELQLFLTVEELDNFLPNIHFVKASGVLPEGKVELNREEVLSLYRQQIEKYLSFPPLYLTQDLETIAFRKVGEQKVIAEVRTPVIVCQEHLLSYSRDDGKFRSMVRGPDAISWGIQLSFPQIFEDPKTGEAVEALALPNGLLFREMQRWARKNTRPTPVSVEGKKQNLVARVGKENMERARSHPKLRERGIEIEW